MKWSGALLPYDREILVIGPADEESRRALAKDLSLIGIHRISGVFSSDDFSQLSRAGIEMDTGAHIEASAAGSRGRRILDVRGRSEYEEGHIPGALNIPLVELQRRLEEIPPGPVVVHCQGGSRAAIAASILQQSGRLEVANMTGGFTEWTRSGNPVETEVAHQRG